MVSFLCDKPMMISMIATITINNDKYVLRVGIVMNGYSHTLSDYNSQKV